MTIIDKILLGQYRQRIALMIGLVFFATAIVAAPVAIRDRPEIPLTSLVGAALMNGMFGAILGLAMSYLKPRRAILERERALWLFPKGSMK